VNYNKISTVASAHGIYDLLIVFWVDDITDFYGFWKKTLEKYGNLFSENIFSLYIQGIGYPKSFLIYDKSEKIKPIRIDHFGISKNIKIDEIDYILLNEISLNARKPLVDLAEKISCSSQNIIYRIDKLKRNGLIQSFRTEINLSKLGYTRYKVNIKLIDFTNRMNIIRYLERNPSLNYFSVSLGLCDLEFELIVEDVDHLANIMDDINDQFPNTIRNYDYYSRIIDYKETFLPELIETDFKKIK
jgi:DNA-binding Lrp family transcriptional regulator